MTDKKAWRPSGWENPYEGGIKVSVSGLDVVNVHSDAIFEAGADAMLEALRKQGTQVKLINNTPRGVAPNETPDKIITGTIITYEVFIPDNKEIK